MLMFRFTPFVLLAGLALGAPADTKRGSAVYGVVKAVDAAKGTVTLEQDMTYDVAKDATVLLDGPGKLADLPPGTRVALEFAAGGKTVTEIGAEPFRITVKPKKDKVEVNQPFDVELRVVNASPSPQSFRVMSCSWDEHWRSSEPRVTWVAWPCFNNGPVQVKLAPGEAYEKTLPMRLTAAGRVSFKMGFAPVESKRTYWSSEVSLEGQDKK
jgi:hypothetical protein